MRIGGVLVCGALVTACTASPQRNLLPDLMPERVSAEDWALMAAATNTVLAELRDTATICVTLLHGPTGFDIPDAHLAMLNHTRVVPATACPRTYASMIHQVDSLGRPLTTRPPGYVDPNRVHVSDPRRDGPFHAWVEIRVQQGSGGIEHLCSVFTEGVNVSAYCRAGRAWFH